MERVALESRVLYIFVFIPVPARLGQSRDSLRCGEVLEPMDTTSMTSEGTTTTRGDSWRYKGPKSLLGPASPAKRNPEKAMLF